MQRLAAQLREQQAEAAQAGRRHRRQPEGAGVWRVRHARRSADDAARAGPRAAGGSLPGRAAAGGAAARTTPPRSPPSSAHPAGAAAGRPVRQRGHGPALLGHRADDPRAAGARGLGRQGDRSAGRGSARGLPRHEGLLAAQPQVHARLRRGLAGAGNCASRLLARIPWYPQLASAGELAEPRRAALVRPARRSSRAGRAASSCCRSRPRPRAPGQGDHQLPGHAAARATPTWPPRSSRIPTSSTSSAPPTRAASARSSRRSSITSSAVLAGARRRLRVRRPPGAARGRRPGLRPRPALLPPEAAAATSSSS